MLYYSLVLTLLLLVIANLVVWRSKAPVLTYVVIGLAFTFAPVCLMFFSSPTALQALFLLAAVIAWRVSKRSRWWFVPLSGVATLLTCAVTAWMVRETETKYDRLREEFAYQSMEARVPAPRASGRALSLPDAVGQRLDDLETKVESRASRGYLLKRLHEDRVELFINSPGFGVTRMFYPTRGELTFQLRQGPAPVQPNAPTWSTGDVEVNPRPWEGSDLSPLHTNGVLDFLNPLGFGFIKDRRHVAGFQPHQFSMVPKPVERWEVHTLDLIGLLLHDEPMAYVSANLPRMDELRDAPTRPLDSFEAAGLKAIREGDDLYIRRAPEGARMIGALRATKQCVACHGGERGDLLGAFSYRLQRAAP